MTTQDIINSNDQISDARLYNPNLTCRFTLTRAPDGKAITLVGMNKDGEQSGIIDEQIFQSLYNWGLTYAKNLEASGAKPPREIPSCDLYLCVNSNASAFTVTCYTLNDDAIMEDVIFVNVLLAYCQGVAKQFKMNLNGEANA